MNQKSKSESFLGEASPAFSDLNHFLLGSSNSRENCLHWEWQKTQMLLGNFMETVGEALSTYTPKKKQI